MVKFCHKLPNKKDTRKAIPGVGKSELFYPCVLLNYKKSMKAQLVSHDRKQFEAAGETDAKAKLEVYNLLAPNPLECGSCWT